MQAVRIGLLGCGTVGGGVVKLLRRNAAMLTAKLGARIEIAGVADRSLNPDPALGLTAGVDHQGRPCVGHASRY